MTALHLTEAWRTAIFLGLVSILLFGLGLPALLFQLIPREAIKQVAEKNRAAWDVWVSRALVFAVAVAAAGFLWESVLPDRIVDVVTASGIASVLFVMVVYWNRASQWYSYPSVLAILEKRLHSARALDNGALGEKAEELVVLARASQSDDELTAAFQVLLRLARALTTAKAYTGDALGVVIEAIPRMSAPSSIRLPSASRSAVDALTAVESMVVQAGRDDSIDSRRIVSLWFELGCDVLRSVDAERGITFASRLGDNPLMLFRFGVRALQSGSDVACIACCDSLGALGQSDREAEHYFVGLSSHLAARSRTHGAFVVSRLQLALGVGSLDSALDGARDYFAAAGHGLDTIEQMAVLQEQLTSMKAPPAFA